MTLVISKGITLRKGWQPMDSDAAAYITAVETADAEPLEERTKIAIDNFVLGCKADGIWNAIKASCILAGARTLTGALVPLVGTAPTNVDGLFVSGDYNRKTGLIGDGSTKIITTNRNGNSDPQNNIHYGTYVTVPPSGSNFLLIAGNTHIQLSTGNYIYRNRSSSFQARFGAASVTGFVGMLRDNSTQFTSRQSAANLTANATSSAPASDVITSVTNARLAFYSIGESLDLALLDARVTDLINAFAAAIP
jgi:hypothetical protein